MQETAERKTGLEEGLEFCRIAEWHWALVTLCSNHRHPGSLGPEEQSRPSYAHILFMGNEVLPHPVCSALQSWRAGKMGQSLSFANEDMEAQKGSGLAWGATAGQG